MRWQALAFGLTVALAIGGQSTAQAPPLPPEARVTVGQLQAMTPEARIAYLAGVADGFALNKARTPQQQERLNACMRGFMGPQLADAYKRQLAGGPVAKMSDGSSAAMQLLLVMAGECQLQETR